eukprot:CAMPEP_0119425194 /NCGR_PEP_ID=MMETSP1335-20130426/34084_1 /TAXON_ID=259385 /ORGANISM="Chrysoculter rhomboideus, Strain RCC1486" /LENGTH=199 /DNA_ID=CAMNT_0007450749 /DNA_START=1 /DNA_END=600 /DNA_ORIENTATION=+
MWAKFHRFDQDKSGELQAAELSALMGTLGMRLSEDEAEVLVRQLDVNNTGGIEFSELVAWYTDRMNWFEEQEAERRKHRPRWRVIWEDEMKIPRKYKIAIAWLTCWTLYCGAAYLSIVFAVMFGEHLFSALLQAWGLALTQTFVVDEPFIIWMYLALPSVIDALTSNEVMAELLANFLASGLGSAIGSCFNAIKTIGGA